MSHKMGYSCPLARPGVLTLTLPCFCQGSSEAAEGGVGWSEEVAEWWGEWNSWSTCSRSCGGGVAARERHCLRQLPVSQGSNSSVCLGQSKHYQLCQQQPCPADTASFKEHQCANFNAKAFGKRYFHWVPLYPDDDTSISNKPCDLQCTTRSGERQLMARAQDGTSCRDRTYRGVCIGGKCEPIGCDGSLYSSQVMDRCRVCGGDGSTCYRVSGNCAPGHLVVLPPAGAARRLSLCSFISPSVSSAALADESGHFFFNGNSAIDNPQNFRVAGTVFKYRRPSNLHSDGLEYIIAPGPTNQSLNAMVSGACMLCPSHGRQKAMPSVAQGLNATWDSLAPKGAGERFLQGNKHSGVAFSGQLPALPGTLELARGPAPQLPDPGAHASVSPSRSNDFELSPLGHDDISLADMYRWKVSPYAPCSSTCTSGSFAPAAGRLGLSRCCFFPAPPLGPMRRWETSRWSECSRTCSEGSQFRTVRCWKMLAPGFDSSVYDDLCESAGLARPMERKSCKSKACGPQWELSEWSECSARCGGSGTMKREVRCSDEASLCSESAKPVSERECAGAPCDRRWTASEWGPCSGLCGEGRMSRFVTCRNLEGKVISDSQCDPSTRPLAVHPCGERNCPAHWVEQDWDQCNASCGRGVKMRTVLCVGLENGLYREYPELQCGAAPKPDTQASCFQRLCSTWFSTSWSQCSKTCGPGLRVREVKCYHGEALGQGCEAASKPEARQLCQLHGCPTDAPDEDCEDKASANCGLVLKVKLCSHWYYRKACCRSCRNKAT
uniref:PLAC domain-containing protein n=1 Tax=Varanus komodoensis TaxID=61221 RepID=A0A8D2JDE1_VARKO